MTSQRKYSDRLSSPARVLAAACAAVLTAPHVLAPDVEPQQVMLDVKLVEVTLNPVHRRLIGLDLGVDYRGFMEDNDLDVGRGRTVNIPPGDGGGSYLSYPIGDLEWLELKASICGATGVTSCEDDPCQNIQLPDPPRRERIESVPVAVQPLNLPGNVIELDVKILDIDSKPLVGFIRGAPLHGSVENLIDGNPLNNPVWDGGGLSLGAKYDLGYGLKLNAGYNTDYELSAGTGWEQETITFTPGDGSPTNTDTGTSYGEEIDEVVGILLTRYQDEWLPKHGNSTSVIARIFDKQGEFWVPSEKQRIITIRFDARSNEKGMCLNKDLDAGPQDSPDLYFPVADNPDSDCSDDPSGKGYLFGNCITKEPVNSKQFFIGSEDYGSFARLEASCPDCVPLKRPADAGSLPDVAVEANTALKEHMIDVPVDENDNQISDFWWEDNMTPVQAADDKDYIPKGNGVEGDGLSCYEEYRGFMTKGTHTRTSFFTKDYFLFNFDELPLWKFRDSKLSVHEIDQDEMRDGKGTLINFNGGHAHVVDQNAVKMFKNTALDSMGRTVATVLGLMGPPKNVDVVRISTVGDSDVAATVAHELGHSVMIRHHGPHGKLEQKQVFYVEDLRGWPSYQSLSGISVSTPELCGVELPATITFGEQHTVTSGYEKCVMRYYPWGRAFMRPSLHIDCAHPDDGQREFCSSKNGASYNANERAAGSATRGDCRSQIQVNDK